MGEAKRKREQKSVFISRPGAYGDVLITTPVLPMLHKEGYRIVYHTSERGEEVLRNNPYIDKLIVKQKDEIPVEQLEDWINVTAKALGCERIISFTEYIESIISLHPRNSEYVYPKSVRFAKCNKNYYEQTMERAGLQYTHDDLIPQLFFTQVEKDSASKYVKPGLFNILWCLSGSGNSKLYPYIHEVCERLVNENKDVHIITVGDNKCRQLETLKHDRITNTSGDITMRTSMCLTGLVNLVVSPDTGILHASGCYLTPKIGLLGHTNIENITKHFRHDYSLESPAECAPCFRLIYFADLICPRDKETHACWCMKKLEANMLYNRIIDVMGVYGCREAHAQSVMA